MSNTQQSYIVVTIYDQYETGVQFYATLKEAKKEHKKQTAKWESYLAKVLK
jgi:hypothetical protein